MSAANLLTRKQVEEEALFATEDELTARTRPEASGWESKGEENVGKRA